MSATTLSVSVTAELAAELRDASARTGIPVSRILAQGGRLRLDQLATPAQPVARDPLSPGLRATVERFANLVSGAGPEKREATPPRGDLLPGELESDNARFASPAGMSAIHVAARKRGKGVR
jgi:hypothetical protein